MILRMMFEMPRAEFSIKFHWRRAVPNDGPKSKPLKPSTDDGAKNSEGFSTDMASVFGSDWNPETQELELDKSWSARLSKLLEGLPE